MTHHDAPFAERLALAHALIARGCPPPSAHEADQLGAAGRDTQRLHDRVAMLAPILAAERPWHRRTDPDPSTALRAHLLAAVLGCLPNTCCHLRKGGPQAALVLLPQRRAACGRCAATIRRPLTAGDECDVCGEREVATF